MIAIEQAKGKVMSQEPGSKPTVLHAYDALYLENERLRQENSRFTEIVKGYKGIAHLLIHDLINDLTKTSESAQSIVISEESSHEAKAGAIQIITITKRLGLTINQADQLLTMLEEPKPEVLSAQDFLQDYVADYNLPLTRAFGVKLSFNPLKEPINFFADPNQLMFVYRSWISNRCHTMNGCADKELTIWSERVKENFITYVTDNINQQSTGIELPIAALIIKKAGGDLRLENCKNGGGTTYAVCLPIL